MKTIGEILKEARDRKRYSLNKVEAGTKIKKEFIEFIEKNNWPALPDFPVVSGFVKNLASYLGISPKTALALLKRDYPPKKLSINPKPDVGNKFTWTPKYTFWVGILTLFLVILGYLGFQYIGFNSPPVLEIYQPKDELKVTSREIRIEGRTDLDATVKVNNQAVLIDDEGAFEVEIEIFEGTKEIIIEAVSRSGKKTVVVRRIFPELK